MKNKTFTQVFLLFPYKLLCSFLLSYTKVFSFSLRREGRGLFAKNSFVGESSPKSNTRFWGDDVIKFQQIASFSKVIALKGRVAIFAVLQNFISNLSAQLKRTFLFKIGRSTAPLHNECWPETTVYSSVSSFSQYNNRYNLSASQSLFSISHMKKITPFFNSLVVLVQSPNARNENLSENDCVQNRNSSHAFKGLFSRATKNLMLHLVLVLMFVGFSADKLSAATYYSKASGNWNAAGTWGTACGTGTGAVPTAADNVIICSGHVVTVTASGTCLTLTISDGGVLTEDAANSTSIVITSTTLNSYPFIVNSGGTFISSGKLLIAYESTNYVKWTIPTGVTSIYGLTIGAGGGGSRGATGTEQPGGGGGGLRQNTAVGVTAATDLRFKAGASAAIATNGTSGGNGDSSVIRNTSSLLLFGGGGRGATYTATTGTGGAGGTGTTISGTITGGNGGNGGNTSSGTTGDAGGGGAGGYSAAGGNGVSDGSTFGTSNNAGQTASASGGGGAGGTVSGTLGGGGGGTGLFSGTSGGTASAAGSGGTAGGAAGTGGGGKYGGGAGGSDATAQVRAGNGVVAISYQSSCTIGNNAVSTGDICSGAESLVHSFSITPSNGAITIRDYTFSSTGTWTTSDVTSFKLYYQASSSFNISTATLLGTKAVSATGAQAFGGITFKGINSIGYFFVTAVISSGATAGRTIIPTATTVANVTSSPTASSTSNTSGQTMSIRQGPTASVGSALSAICQSATSAAMGGSVGGSATGGTWSGGAGSWTNATNPSTATYTASSSESGTITLTLTTSGGSCGTTTSTKNITVNSSPSITGQPANQSVTPAETATFTVTATGTTLTYQWQEYAGSSWANITNGGVYSNSTTATLTITSPSLTLNGYKYRCVVSGTCSPTATSNGNATLSVNYCTPVSSGNSYYINGFTTTSGVTNITNTGTTTSVTSVGYSNYSSTLSCSQYANSSISFVATTNASYGGGFSVFVDWDNSGTFDVTTERVYTSNDASLITTGTQSFTVPLAQAVGNYRMRVAFDYNTAIPISCPITGSIESEDYTFTVLGPAIVLADNGTQVAAANVSPGTTNLVVHKSQLTVGGGPLSLTGMTCTTAGTYVSADITNLKVWYSTSSTFATGTSTLLSTYTTPGAAGAKTFPSFTTQSVATGTGYIYITADVASGATNSNTINLSALATSNFTFTTGTLSGSTTAGGAQTFVSSSIALADNGTQVAASNVTAGTTNVVLHQSQVTVSSATASLTGMTCTTAGTYASADITNLKVWYAASSTFNSGTATLLSTYTTPGIAGSKTFPSFTAQSIAVGTGYIYITADVAAAATNLNTINVSALTTSNLTFASGSKSGSTTTGGTKTILLPGVVLADNGTQVTASTENAGTTNLVLHQSQLTVSSTAASLTGMTCTTAGTYVSADITNLKVWYASSSTFNSGTATLLSTFTTPGAAGSKTFPSFTTQSIAVGTGYIYITADIAAAATNANTINVSALTTSNFTFSAASLSGSTSAGGVKTIIKYCSPSLAGSAGYGITNVTFNTISNTTSASEIYTDYTSTVSTTVYRGSPYNISVYVNTGGAWTYNQYAWIDWNQNGVFTDAGESYSLGNLYNSTAISSLCPLSITVPAGASLGTTRMRVSSNYTSSASVSCPTNHAEVEDYKIIVSVPPLPTITSLDLSSVCSGGNLVINGTNLTGVTASDVTIGGTAVSAIVTNTGTVLTVTVGAGTSGTVSVTTSGGTATSSSSITVNSTPSIPSASAATSAGATSFTANWEASTGSPTGYILDVASDNAFTSLVSGYNALNVGNFLTYNVTGLSSATTYYYRVKATNGTCTSAVSSTITATTTCLALSGIKTVGTGGDYTTFSDASGLFNAINNCGLSGNLSVNVISNITETGAIALNQWTETGIGGYSVTISPSGGATRTLSGSVAGPLITLNGADRVTFDGLNTGSNALVISNTSTSTLASTIKLQADASNNTINNTSVLGSSTSATIGTIWFSTGTTTGNITNTINNCTISPAGSNLPYNAIYSLGTSLAIPNTVTVSNNNIADWNITVANSSGILVAGTGNTAWNITGNKMYQTASRVGPTGTVYGINILTGNGHTVNTNIVGYASSSATGALTITSGTAVNFIGINLNVLTSTATEVQGNTINGITMATTSSSTTGNGIFTGIYIAGGKANVGQTTGNTIGSTTSTGITTTASSGTNGILTNGIASASTSTVVIKNNTIAGISALGSAVGKSTQLLGIFTAGNAGNYTINGNTIGSTSGPLNVGSATTTGPSYMCGIYNSATGTIVIGANGGGNTVQYMNCNGSNINSYLYTIYSIAVAGSLNIDYNSISNNTISSPGKATFYLYEGILNTGAVTGTISISNNTIGAVTISGTSVVGAIAGINNAAAAATSTVTINSNSISGISISNTSSGGVYLISQTGTPLTETINNNSFNALSLKTTGTINFIFNDYTAPPNGSKTVQGNSVGTSFTRNASGSLGDFYGYYDYGSSPSSVSHTISGNNFTNVNTGTSSNATYEICGIYSADYSSSNPSLTVYDNTISNWTISAGDGTFTGIYAGGFGGTSSSPNLVYGNTISNCTSASTSLGQIGLGVGSVGLYVNVYENTISNNAINGAAAQFNGIYVYGTTNNNKFYNNTITNLTSNTTAALIGVWIASTGGPQIDVYQNKINTFSCGGNLYGVYVNGGTAVNVYNHSVSGANNYSIFGLTTSGATSIVEGIRIAGGTTINMYSNNIYNLSNSSSSTTATNSLVNGLSFTAGTTVNAYNNLVSKLTAPSVSYIDAVRGISVTSTTALASYNIYSNTLFLDASSTGTNFGTSGIYHTANATATTAKLNLINNIVINTSTPKGTGGVVTALRRSASATLGNFATTSNNNMYYAGTPSATQTIMYDGTNAYQTATTYLAAVSTRETNSFSEIFDYPTAGSFFSSVTATDATYLKPGQCADTRADGGGVAIGSVTVDYAVVSRATPPDIGAWEFSKFVPTITTTGTITAVCNSASVQTSSLAYTATTNSPTSYSIDWDATANTAGLADQGSTNLAFASGTGSVSTISITAATPAGTYNGVMSIVNAYGCSKTQAVTIVVNPLPTATWAATATDACYSASAQTTTLAYTATTNTPTSYSISWNSSPTNSFVAVTDQANTFTAAGGAGTITIAIPAGTAAGTYTGTITVKNANTCLSSAVQTFTIVVNPVTTASVSISATPDGTICTGTSVTFTAAPTNGGAAPTYQWKKNGVDISGETASTYVTTSLANSDAITVVMTSNATPCLTSSPATSNTITGTVSSPTPGTMTTYVGDYVWNGLVSTDFANVNNWYHYSSAGAYTIATSAPNSTIGVVIPVSGTCIINQPTISSGTVSTDSLTILSGATLTIGSGVTVNVGDNFTNNGTLVANVASTVNFIGSTNQSIGGTASSTFGNVTINKTSATNNVTIGTDATILGTLTLTIGKLTVSGTKTLSIGNTTSNGTISGGSSNSYIVAFKDLVTSSTGTLKRFVNTAASTAYNLPIGDASKYTPMTFTLASATLSNASISVFTKAEKVAGINSLVTNYLNRYWDLTPSGITGADYSVDYTYATTDIQVPLSEALLLPVKRSLTSTGPDVYTWYKPIGSTFIGGVAESFTGTSAINTTTHTLSWSGLSTFSQFTAAGDQVVNLPIDLLSFDAKKQNQNNLLFWSTATETNCDYFTIEKTIDGESYEVVGNVNGGGTSFDVLNYTLVDYDVRKAINYYRLKQIDTDGAEKISALVSVDNRDNLGKEVAMKTNLLGQEINENYRGVVIIVFTDGTSIKIIQ